MPGLILRAFEIIEAGWVGAPCDLVEILRREGFSHAELHQFTGTALRKQLQQAMKQVALQKAEAVRGETIETDAAQPPAS